MSPAPTKVRGTDGVGVGVGVGGGIVPGGGSTDGFGVGAVDLPPPHCMPTTAANSAMPNAAAARARAIRTSPAQPTAGGGTGRPILAGRKKMTTGDPRTDRN